MQVLIYRNYGTRQRRTSGRHHREYDTRGRCRRESLNRGVGSGEVEADGWGEGEADGCNEGEAGGSGETLKIANSDEVHIYIY